MGSMGWWWLVKAYLNGMLQARRVLTRAQLTGKCVYYTNIFGIYYYIKFDTLLFSRLFEIKY